MTNRPTFTTTDLSKVAPIEFDLDGQIFRVPRKQRHDIMLYVSRNLVEVEGGEKLVKADACRQAILLFLASELYDPEAPGEPLDPQPSDPTGAAVAHLVQNADGVWCDLGAWVPVDDKDRFVAITTSSRVDVPDQVYGDILDYITREVTGHPTGAPS